MAMPALRIMERHPIARAARDLRRRRSRAPARGAIMRQEDYTLIDLILPLRQSPKEQRPRDGITAQNSVRAYRESPDRVGLQIRGERAYLHASLTFAQAAELAAQLQEFTQ